MEGNCILCQKYTELTKEHVPPRKSGNTGGKNTRTGGLEELLGITSEEIEQTVVDSISSDTNRDTRLVPANKENFEELFLNQNKWESINIGDKNIPNIKYIAAYVTKSNIGKGQYVSHYAKVNKIIPSEEYPGKYSVQFEGIPVKLSNDILLGTNLNLAVQSMRYTSFKELLNAKTLQDLFS